MNVTINNSEESHARYQALVKYRPEFFVDDFDITYVTDPKAILDYEAATGERLGILYQDGSYEVFVTDLVLKDGKLKVHGRIVLPDNGVIIIPKLGDKFILEDQYRYPVCAKHLAFPRGHCERDTTPEQDAIREIEEELKGAKLTNIKPLHETYPETHSDAWFCSIFLGDVEGLDGNGRVISQDGYEGIDNLVLLTADEIDALIADGTITCGYTLAAWAEYRARFPKN